MRGVAFICFLLLMVSCSEAPFYSEMQEVDPLSWTYDTSKSFTVDITDTAPFYDMHLTVGHTTAYRYQNMYMRIITSFPESEDKVEQLNIDLAEKNGQWVGKCSGESCSVKVYLLEKFKFADPGTYTFLFEQYGRDKILEGIESLELEILKIEEQKS